VKIEIYDLLGRKVETDYYGNSKGEYYLNISNQPNGLYIVRISNGQYVINKKIMLSK
jgi:hypothetical protein